MKNRKGTYSSSSSINRASSSRRTKRDSLRVLFLSAQKSHTEMFLRIIQALRISLNLKVDFAVICTKEKNFDHPTRDHPVTISKRGIQMIEQMITNYEPHILVLANDNFHASNSFIRICRLKGIPSLLIQDGIIGRKTLGSFDFIRWWNFACWRFISKVLDSNLASKLSVSLGCQWVVPDWGMGKSTKIAAMGRYYKQVLVSRGISAESIVVTGYPLLDDIVTSSPHPKNRKLLEELGLQSARPIILLLTQPFVEDHVWSRNTRDEFVDLVRHSVEQINGQLVIKIHPREDSNVYNSIIREKHISSPIVITKDRDLNTLIQSSDVVLTVNSTAGLWVLANEKPLLVVNCFETISENIFEDLATTIDVSTGLTNMIRKVLAETQQIRKSRLSSEHSSTSLRTHLHQLDGKASERIARVIFEMAQRDCLKS